LTDAPPPRPHGQYEYQDTQLPLDVLILPPQWKDRE
jgi:hypothetical protein